MVFGLLLLFGWGFQGGFILGDDLKWSSSKIRNFTWKNKEMEHVCCKLQLYNFELFLRDFVFPANHLVQWRNLGPELSCSLIFINFSIQKCTEIYYKTWK